MNSTKQPASEKDDKVMMVRVLKSINRLFSIVFVFWLITFVSSMFGATSIFGVSIETLYIVWFMCTNLIFVVLFVVSSSSFALIVGTFFSYITINIVLDFIAK